MLTAGNVAAYLNDRHLKLTHIHFRIQVKGKNCAAQLLGGTNIGHWTIQGNQIAQMRIISIFSNVFGDFFFVTGRRICRGTMFTQARSIRLLPQVCVIMPVDVTVNHISAIYDLDLVASVSIVERKAQAESKQQKDHIMEHHKKHYQQQILQFESPEI